MLKIIALLSFLTTTLYASDLTSDHDHFEADEFVYAKKQIEPAIFRIAGYTRTGLDRRIKPIGTAFLISKKFRLLATAAHVADASIEHENLTGICNGNDFPYKIDRVWYSPMTTRRLDFGLHAWSQNPSDGTLVYPTYDLAIVRLAKGGPALPEECNLADDSELFDLNGSQVASLGFHGTDKIPTFSSGVLTRSISYDSSRYEDRSSPPSSRRWIVTTQSTAPGTSGGPVFLKNGKVVSVKSISLIDSNSGDRSEDMRVDTLREIIRYHELDKPQNADRSRNYYKSQSEVDRRISIVRQAVRMSAEGVAQFSSGKTCEAIASQRAALALVPQYGAAYIRLSEIYLDYMRKNFKWMTPKDRTSYSNYLLFLTEKSRTYMQNETIHDCEFSNSEWFIIPALSHSDAMLYRAISVGENDIYQKNSDYLTNVLEIGMQYWRINSTQIVSILTRRTRYREISGNLDGAFDDLRDSLKLLPYKADLDLKLREFVRRHNEFTPSMQPHLR